MRNSSELTAGHGGFISEVKRTLRGLEAEKTEIFVFRGNVTMGVVKRRKVRRIIPHLVARWRNQLVHSLGPGEGRSSFRRGGRRSWPAAWRSRSTPRHLTELRRQGSGYITTSRAHSIKMQHSLDHRGEEMWILRSNGGRRSELWKTEGSTGGYWQLG